MKMMKRAMYGGGLIAAAMAAGVAHAAPPAALDKPAFTATPAELLAAAKATSVGTADVVVLLDDNDISYDARGRSTSMSRTIFVVATKTGADNWREISATWLPSFQDKPQLRARVIDANGRAFDLDPGTITEAADSTATAALPTDRRRISATLPHVGVGAVIEEQAITTDREPAVGGGAAHGVGLDMNVPVNKLEVRFSAPKKLHSVAFGLPTGVKPRISSAGGRQVLAYTMTSVPARGEYEGYVPRDIRPFRYVSVSPVASWSSVARDYRSIIDKRISEGPPSLPADIPKTGKEDALRAVVSWLHRQVQYSGVAFDDAAYVPSTPADTLKRGSAGATDLGVLLLAALRQAGVRAELVLIDRGPGPDIDREVPAINEFDHVLVRAHVGNADLWIDPIETALPPGHLSWPDQNRPALVIADNSTAPIATPAANAADNLVHEVRTIELAETGSAKLTEVSREGGVFEAEQREWLRDTSPDTVRKNLGDYLEKEYKAKLDSYSSVGVDDLTKPVEVTVVASDAKTAYTDRDAATVYLYSADTLKKLPEPLNDPKDNDHPRKYDFNVSMPHIYEIENRIVVPVGFTVPAPEPDRTRELGPYRLVEKQRVDGQVLVITFRLEASKARLTPAEVTSVQQAVRELRREHALHVVIPQTAISLAEAGKYRDAVAEANKLIKLHPKEALHHEQLAQVLTDAGAGEAARRAARKAVELEPKNADPYVMLGWVLQHDTFGGWLGFDHDHTGAVAALRQARKLDPNHIGALTDLAGALERDDRGRRFDAGSDVAGAIETWRALYALDASDEHALSLAEALLWAGQGAEAEKVLRALPAGEYRDELLITAVAVARGGDAGVREAASLASGTTRAQYIGVASSKLFLMRQYDAMRVLMAPTAAKQSPQLVQAMQRLARVDTPFKPTKSAHDIVIEMALHQLHPERASNPYWDKATRDEMEKAGQKGLTMFGRNEMMTTKLLEDIVRSALEVKIEGDNGLWRSDIEQAAGKGAVYLASDRGMLKVIGGVSDPEGAGRHLLRLLAKNDEKNALRLLDWLAQDLPSRGAKDGLASGFSKLWGTNLPRDRKAMELVAAILTGYSDAARAIPILEQCKPTTKEGQLVCDWDLADLYAKAARWGDLATHAHAWAARAPQGMTRPAVEEAYALAHLGRFDDADKLVADAIAKEPDNRSLVIAHSDLAVGRGQLAESVRRLDPLTKAAKPDPMALNDAAWLKLFEGTDVPNAALLGRQAVQLSPHERHILNTIAAIEAELGELGPAKEHLDGSIDARTSQTPPIDADRYVHARMLEQLGFTDDAIASYRQIKPQSSRLFTPDASQFAARRLKALGVKK